MLRAASAGAVRTVRRTNPAPLARAAARRDYGVRTMAADRDDMQFETLVELQQQSVRMHADKPSIGVKVRAQPPPGTRPMRRALLSRSPSLSPLSSSRVRTDGRRVQVLHLRRARRAGVQVPRRARGHGGDPRRPRGHHLPQHPRVAGGGPRVLGPGRRARAHVRAAGRGRLAGVFSCSSRPARAFRLSSLPPSHLLPAPLHKKSSSSRTAARRSCSRRGRVSKI